MVAFGNDMSGSSGAEREAPRDGRRPTRPVLRWPLRPGLSDTVLGYDTDVRRPSAAPLPTSRKDPLMTEDLRDTNPLTGAPRPCTDQEIADGRCPDTVAEVEVDLEGPTQEIVRKGGTFESFRHRDYTLFWLGAMLSNVGSWMQQVVLNQVVYDLRGFESDSGIIALVAGLPVFFLAIPAGVLADRLDRRRLLIGAQAALALQALALGALYAVGYISPSRAVTSLAWIGGLSLVSGVFSALTMPSWQSILPDLVPRKDLLNAIALNSAQFNTARLLGPVLAGAALAAGLSRPGIFYVNAASFLLVIAALAVIRPRQDDRRSGAHESIRDTVLGGLRYARENRATGMLLLSVAMLTVFGMAYATLMPAFIHKALGYTLGSSGAQQTLAWIMAANGLGAVVGALVVAGVGSAARRDVIVRFGLLSMSLLLLGFAASRTLWLTLAISTLAGAAFLTSVSAMNTSIQATVPHELRGRVMALFVMAFMGIMPFSGFIFGLIGQAVGPAISIAIGAAVLLVYSVALVARPGLIRAG
jgi:MFS family permease